VTGAGVPLPGVSITARVGDVVARATSTGIDGQYQLALPEGTSTIAADLAGFERVEQGVALGGASCRQTLDLTLALTPRSPRRAPTAAPEAQAAAGGRGRAGQGGQGGDPGASRFQTLDVAADAAGASLDARLEEPADAPQLLLPPGFENEASSDAIAVTGNVARVDRDQLRDRFEAFARGDLGLDAADLTAALAQAGGLPFEGRFGGALEAPAGRGGFAGPDGGRGRGAGNGGQRGRGAGPAGAQDLAFVLGGRQGRGNRIQSTADYSFGGSALDSSPHQLRSDARPERRPYTRQTFGTTLGGPLKIPRLYDNPSNRTSFTLGYNASRGSNLFDQYATVPTDAMRAGDFSSSAGTLIDPLTGQPFAGNRIPADRVSPQARALLGYIPAPNLPGTTRNYHYTTTTASVNDSVNLRVQHAFGSAAGGRGGRGGRGGGGRGGGRGTATLPLSVSLNAQLQYRRSDADQTNVFSTLGGRNESTTLAVPVNVNVIQRRELHAANVNLSRTGSTTSNRFTGVENVAGAAGIAGVSTDPFAWGVPALSFTSVSSLRDVAPSRRRDRRLSVDYSWTHPMGRHSLRAGTNVRLDRLTSHTEANANGSFVFTGLYSSGTGAIRPGFDVADFLLGLPQQATVQYGPGDVTLEGRSLSLFLQDDWRTRGDLTLALGLRYELLWPFTEQHGRLVNLDAAPGFASVAPVTAGGAGAFTGDFPAALLLTDTNNFAPRLGLAWRVGQRLILRGGYGVSYNSGAYAAFARQFASQPPFAVTNTQLGALNSILLMESALTGGSPTETTNTFGVDKQYALGRVQTWNVDLQRSLSQAWTVSANYTHTRGSSLDMVRAPNRGPDGLRIEGVQPFLWQTSEGSSILHSATFTLQRRQVRGLGGRVTYVLARSRDNAPSIGGGTVVAQNDQDIESEWGLSNFDRRHRLTAELSAELPFGPNRPWLSNGGVWASLLENWRLSANVVVDAGTPLTARLRGAARDVAQGQNGALRADYNGQPVGLDDPTIDRFFNTDAFAVPAPGLFGTSARNLIIGPGSRQVDGQLSRDIRLGGTRALTIQVRATNLLNLVNYTAIDAFVNSPTFGQVTSVRPMRSAQLNLRFRF
jgi:hypothetical protein